MRIYDLIQLARQYMLLGVIVVILLLTGYFLLYKKLMKGTDKLNKFKELKKALMQVMFV